MRAALHDNDAIEFEVHCVWEASVGWVRQTAAIEFRFVVLINVLERVRVDVMVQVIDFKAFRALEKIQSNTSKYIV